MRKNLKITGVTGQFNIFFNLCHSCFLLFLPIVVFFVLQIYTNFIWSLYEKESSFCCWIHPARYTMAIIEQIFILSVTLYCHITTPSPFFIFKVSDILPPFPLHFPVTTNTVLVHSHSIWITKYYDTTFLRESDINLTVSQVTRLEHIIIRATRKRKMSQHKFYEHKYYCESRTFDEPSR